MALAVTLVSSGTLTSRAASQVRENFTFHVYVDPIYGDDVEATTSNPTLNTISSRSVGADYPRIDFPDSAGNNGTGFLQHAPFPFRTLSGSNGGTSGALDYIESLFRSDPLPWQPVQGVEQYITDVVVHLLPGLYGPATPTAVDAASGLPWNDESWPALLPEGVSLQGTSALDTIFDARGEVTSVIVVGVLTQSGLGRNTLYASGSASQQFFVDGVTIRNARASGQLDSTGAGIAVGDEEELEFTISNCFLVENDVGVAVESDENGTPFVRIVNNTLAWNQVGIWNGDRNSIATPPTNEGRAPLLVWNNIIDTLLPGTTTQRVPFQGMQYEDMTVVSGTDGATTFTLTDNFNAFSPTNANAFASASLAVFTTWPRPSTRLGSIGGTGISTPRVDLSPYYVGGRGALFINDVFRTTLPGPNNDLSPHDFRLAPHVALANEPGPWTRLNPMLARGIFYGGSSPLVSITFGNTIQLPKTLLPGAPGNILDGLNVESGFAVFDAWDLDAEGFGNPRVAGFASSGPGQPPGSSGAIDLGADELGELVMAGYLPNTRTYSNEPAGGGAPDWERIYFFNFRNPAPYPRPRFNALAGEVYDWYTHAQGITARTGGTNYTDGGTLHPTSGPLPVLPFDGVTSRQHIINNPTAGNPLLPASLFCDFAGPVSATAVNTTSVPNLVFAPIEPLWGSDWFAEKAVPTDSPVTTTLFGTSSGGDVFSWNPWYGDVTPRAMYPPGGLGLLPTRNTDNFQWYHRATTPPLGSAEYSARVRSGTMHPPGATIPAFPGAGHLNYWFTNTVLTAFTPCTAAGSTTYQVGLFGYGDSSAGCPDQWPVLIGLEGNGVRVNCQLPDPTDPSNPFVQTGNLQTMLVITNDGQGAQQSRSAAERIPRESFESQLRSTAR